MTTTWPHGTQVQLTADFPISTGDVLPAGTIGTIEKTPGFYCVDDGVNISVKYDYKLGKFASPYYLVTPVNILSAVQSVIASVSSSSNAYNTGTYIHVKPVVGMKVEVLVGQGRWVVGEITEVDQGIYGSVSIRPDHMPMIKYIEAKLDQGTKWRVIDTNPNNIGIKSVDSTKSEKSEKERIWEAIQAAGKR